MTGGPDAGNAASGSYSALSAVSSALSKILMLVSSAVMVLMVLHIVADVVLRHFFSSPLPGTLEIVSHWYMVALAFLPLAYVQWHREHLMVEVFTKDIPPRILGLIDVGVQVVCVALLGLYITQVAIAAVAKTQLKEALEATWFDIPVWPTRWFLPFGLGVMALCILAQLVSTMRSRSQAADREHS
jgi:TRAP-type C4-dicarboxylate transport system permease small subunit